MVCNLESFHHLILRTFRSFEMQPRPCMNALSLCSARPPFASKSFKKRIRLRFVTRFSTSFSFVLDQLYIQFFNHPDVALPKLRISTSAKPISPNIWVLCFEDASQSFTSRSDNFKCRYEEADLWNMTQSYKKFSSQSHIRLH